MVNGEGSKPALSRISTDLVRVKRSQTLMMNVNGTRGCASSGGAAMPANGISTTGGDAQRCSGVGLAIETSGATKDKDGLAFHFRYALVMVGYKSSHAVNCFWRCFLYVRLGWYTRNSSVLEDQNVNL